MHDDYDPANLYNDIALLKLSTPLTLNSQVAKISIPSEKTNFTTPQNCTVSGWGTTSYRI